MHGELEYSDKHIKQRLKNVKLDLQVTRKHGELEKVSQKAAHISRK